MKSKILLAGVLCLAGLPYTAQAIATMPKPIPPKEVSCLVPILYAESRGESIEGIIAIGEATIARAARKHVSICKLRGVARRSPPKRLRHYWLAVAKSISNDMQTPTVGKADSWNTGKKPAYPGKVTRHIGKHTFYVMAGEL